MISKHITRPKNKADSFAKLGNYARDASHEGEKCLYHWHEGCQAESYDIALREIEMTQALNTRTSKDKTYHLMVSFHPEDEPKLNEEILRDIECTFAKKLGLDTHQRVAGVHKNTNNTHLHVAYNLVHPERFTVGNPYFDTLRQAEACQELEKKYGLTIDNRAGHPKKNERLIEPRAANMEAHAGQKSFQTFALERKGDLLLGIENAKNWQEVHHHFAQFGMAIKLQGNGLAVVNRDGKSNEVIKASALDRSLSKARLEGRFGIFVSTKETVEAKELYSKEPLQHESKARGSLYNQFKEQMQQRKALIETTRGQNSQTLKEVKARQAKEKAEFNLKIMARQTKVALRLQMRERHQNELDTARATGGERLADIRTRHQFFNWNGYLKHQAQNGNTEALGVLKSKKIDITADNDFLLQKKLQEKAQAKERKIMLSQDGDPSAVKRRLINITKMDYLVDLERLQRKTGNEPELFDGTTYRIDNNGIIIYNLPNGGTIRDDGEKVYCSPDGLSKKAAEYYSRQRFGKNLVIDGNLMAKRPVSLIKMDALVHMERAGGSEKMFDGTRFHIDGTGRVVTYTLPGGGTIRDDGYKITSSSDQEAHRAAAVFSQVRFGKANELQKGKNGQSIGQSKRQSYIERIKQICGNGLRQLSELPVVRLGGENRMLLQNNARGDMER